MKHRPAPAGTYAEGVEGMKPIELGPQHSTKEISPKCIKSLAEQEVGNCLRALLRDEIENKELVEKYEALVSFLRSPELKKINNMCETYLAQGNEVMVKIYFWKGKPKYKIIIS